MNSRLELLSPAKNAEIGMQAILHGADAVYIGGPSFGARAGAGNPVADIEKLCSFAHRYHARIFATLNTIVADAELEPARKIAWELYHAGVDALIVQDMGLLEIDLPPIELHASTQCDIRTPDKARFLSGVGFSQMVLARELSLPEIKEISQQCDATLEFFIHGAICVAYSGQCYISHAHTGRSANRGDCSQACRLPYTLKDKGGRVVSFEKHLLSMKDNNQSENLRALISAGIRSFKIEGRYKDMAYVKNITAHYRMLLDEILEENPELSRASSGSCTFNFKPDAEKTFHRGATDYFVNGRGGDIGAFDSPKFLGVPIGMVTAIGADWFEIDCDSPLNNGDGLSYMHKREAVGTRVNLAQEAKLGWRVFPNEKIAQLPGLRVGMKIHRNRDHAWELTLTRDSARRRIALSMWLEETGDGLRLSLSDEDGFCAESCKALEFVAAEHPEKAEESLRAGLAKLGSSAYVAADIFITLTKPRFVSSAFINSLRREAIENLDALRLREMPRPGRRAAIEPPVPYPEVSLSFLANVYNGKARSFYEKHGVKLIAAAYEAHREAGEVSLMISKHCLRHSFNLCPKQAKGVTGVQGQVRAEPMTLVSGKDSFTLQFDCRACEMHVLGSIRKNILSSPPPGCA